MSGPTTVVVATGGATVLLAAAAVRAAEAIAAGYAEAADLHADHAEARDANRAGQRQAGEQGRAALEQEAGEAEARFEQLGALAQQIGLAERLQATRPLRPAAGDVIALAAYVRGLQALAAELQGILLTEAARRQADLGEAPAEIAAPAAARAATVSARLLARIAHLGAVPEDLAKLARELDDTPPGERAELLASELRLRIQAHLEAVQAALVREATATVVEASLKDLGYQVEEVAHTLFVEGGVVHFRRPGWGDYMIRMRVDAQAGTANFNVVRAVEAGQNERSVLDHIAEDRWCAEFPALLEALAARGVHLQVTRRLEAGELPVQLVTRDKLPNFADEEAEHPATQVLAREIK